MGNERICKECNGEDVNTIMKTRLITWEVRLMTKSR